MKRFLSALMLAGLFLSGLSCRKDAPPAELAIGEISSVSFGAEGGLGTAEILAGGAEITAESSEPEWLRVDVEKSTVLFNVFSWQGDTGRSAEITVSAHGCTPVSFTVTQSAFRGIVVSDRQLEFSDSERSLMTFVRCDSDYSVDITENPGGIFSFSRTSDGVVFSVNRAQGRRAFAGSAVITPADSSFEPVEVTLSLQGKSDWYYLLGSWTVSSNTDDGGDRSPFVFSEGKPLESFLVTIDRGELAGRPFVAEFVDGKVRIGIQGFSADEAENRYYSLHFNGPSEANPSGWYIWSSPGGAAWDAVPEFDDANGTVTLRFTNARLNANQIPAQLNVWWSRDRYFNFTTKLVSYRNLVLTKVFTE